MTNPKKPTPDESFPDYLEYHYPYVLPEFNVVLTLPTEDINSLTPLELVFIGWYMEVGNADIAIDKLIHPAKYFEKETHGAKVITNRPLVRDMILKIKKGGSYSTMYNAERIAKILHDEVEYLRQRNRHQRFYGAGAKVEMFGKKSKHEEEMSEVNLLLRCVELLGNMTNAIKATPNASDTESSDKNSSVNRVLADAEKLIHGTEIRINGQLRNVVEESS